MSDYASIEEFRKLDIRIGTVIESSKVESADKLIKLKIDFGEKIGTKQILTGMAEFFAPEYFIGKQLPAILNFKSRTIRNELSEGMILAVNEDVENNFKPILLHPENTVKNGVSVI